MSRRHKKASRKYLGTRNHGKGNAKNKRGKGGKGGWGRAGMHKHRWSYITRYEPDFFGVQGFSRPGAARLKEINLFEINRLAMQNKLEKADGKLNFKFDGKVLGQGALAFPVVVSALQASASAVEKIKAAGGEFKQTGQVQKA
ncbi:50S ribosomal protein L15 [Candidatus Parvarchaeota archaeon]|nr:50S ribosomal protein L15 [Candidatus Parvarchaeota archaeon]